MFWKGLYYLSVSESELDVVIEAATDEEEEDVSCLIFSRTLSTFPDTSATFSDVDWPSVVVVELWGIEAEEDLGIYEVELGGE